MRWEDYRQSTNVEYGGGGGGFPMGRASGGIGIGGLIMAGLLYFVFGVDPSIILGGGGPSYQPRQEQQAPSQIDPNDRVNRFVSAVLATTEDTWEQIFREANRRYEQPRLVIFQGQVRSACGAASAESGPFYCPMDRRIYIDTVFFNELARRFRAPGDFAAAYVVGHEVGHHVQNLLGILQQVKLRQDSVGQAQANELQVRVELQADCYAGVWANRTNRAGLLEPGDVEEALRAAAAIGDDALSQGRARPETFTHGTSEQRQRWFMTGARSGRPQDCDTFSAQRL
jgi:predicted metalloprotease